MKTLGIGVIGWGFMGKTHTNALREMPLFYPDAGFHPKLISVCTRRPEMAQAAAQACGFIHQTTDYRETLARPDVDVVSICTPNKEHLAMTLAALKAGKHVYVDKPMAMNEDEAAQIVEAVARSGKRLQVAHNNRFWPSVMRAKALIDEGRIGQILSFRFEYLHSGSVDPLKPIGWKQTGQGGVLLDLGSHALDLALYFLGDVREVLCETQTLYPERPTRDGGTTRDLREDQAVCLLKLPDGAVGTVVASKIATGADDDLSFHLCGTKGALRWHSMNGDYLSFFDNTRPEGALGGERGFTQIASAAYYPAPGGQFLPPKNTIGWDRPHMHSYYSFLDALVAGREPSPNAVEALRLQRLMDALLRSAEGRHWVALD